MILRAAILLVAGRIARGEIVIEMLEYAGVSGDKADVTLTGVFALVARLFRERGTLTGFM